ncbi:hypothetical protein ACIP93_00530 [Streptomyces sp. NPDC088745]|uniref:hypothetical protein n=1 Tax=Streptomyces sp. NPDC088745 TaxID=3365884 RepID=UPI00382C1660
MNQENRELPSPSDAFSDNPTAEAYALTDELAEILARHGITLPSLRVDLPSCTAVPARPLIELGRANATTVRLLVGVLDKAAAR